MAAREITLNLRPDRINGAFIQSYRNASALLLSSFYREEKVSLRIFFASASASGGLAAPLALVDASAYSCHVGIGLTDGAHILCFASLTWNGTDSCFEGVLNINTSEMNTALGSAAGASISRTFEVELKKSDEEFTFQQVVTIKNEVLTTGGSLPADVTDELFAEMLIDTISGRETIWVPAGAMTPRDTAGATPYSLETPTNKIMLPGLAFDPDAIKYAQFQVTMPKSWDKGTVVVRLVTTWEDSNTGGIVWGAQALAFHPGSACFLDDAAFGTAQEITAGTITPANPLYISYVTLPAITVGASPIPGTTPLSAESMVVFQVYRKGTAGADTYISNVLLLGANVFYNTNTFNDD